MVETQTPWLGDGRYVRRPWERANQVVYYESIKRKLKTRPIYGCRCDERLKPKAEESTRLTYTVRCPIGLWARPVIRYRSASGTYRWVTSPDRAGTGEPLHRLEPVPVRGSFPPVIRFSKWQEYRSHRTKSVGLYHPTQRTHIQLNMSSEVRV